VIERHVEFFFSGFAAAENLKASSESRKKLQIKKISIHKKNTKEDF
jgi:hypothetical protein